MPFACIRSTDGQFLLARSWIDDDASPTFGKTWDREGHAKMFARKYNDISKRHKEWYPKGHPLYEETVNRGMANVVEVKLQIVGAVGPGATGLGCILK